MVDSLLTLDKHIEVILTKEGSRFRATTPTFPKCKGIGSDKEEAIIKLSRSIGNYLARKTTKSIEKILTSKTYSEVITTPSSESSDQHLVFSLYETTPVAKQDVFVKLDELQEFFSDHTSKTDNESKQPPLHNELGSNSSIDVASSTGFDLSSVSDFKPGKNLLFGIQFSLN